VGELEDLLRLPVRVGSPDPAQAHRSFLVTNGRVVDEVVVALKEWNERMHGLGYGRLELIQGQELLKTFLDLSTTFVPVRAESCAGLVRLHIAVMARTMLDRERFSELLWRIVFSRQSPSPGPVD